MYALINWEYKWHSGTCFSVSSFITLHIMILRIGVIGGLLLVTVVLASVRELEHDQQNENGIMCKEGFRRNVPPQEMLEKLIRQVIKPGDSDERMQIKRALLQYLVSSETFEEIMKICTNADRARFLQEDEDGDDGDDGGGGGGAGAAGGALDNMDVLMGVRRILANVFTGNLIGVIQESVGLRSPEGVSNVFTDVLSTLFGSQATAGVTGVLANITTVAPPTQNSTYPYFPNGSPYYNQQILLQQQQQFINGVGPIRGPQTVGVQGQQNVGGTQGIRRRPAATGQRQPNQNTRPKVPNNNSQNKPEADYDEEEDDDV